MASFQQAVDLQGNDPIAHVYLAVALNQRYVSGVNSPENVTIASRAEAEFRRALELDSSNWPALVMLAKLMLDQGKFEESRAWREWRAAFRGAHRPPEFEKDLLNEGISNLQQALKLDPANRNARGFLAAFTRDGADLSSMAGPWDERFLAAKKRERPPDGSVTVWPPAACGNVPTGARCRRAGDTAASAACSSGTGPGATRITLSSNVAHRHGSFGTCQAVTRVRLPGSSTPPLRRAVS